MKNLIRKVLPIKKLKLIRSNISIKIIKLMSKTKLLSSVYYLFSGEFKREHNSVLLGKLKHLEDINKESSNHYLLRRNIHRLEKGLLMRPMRKVFAVNYVEETVYCYKSLLNDYRNGEPIPVNELKWAYDVLKKYFEVTDSHKTINRMENVFNDCEHITSEGSKIKYIPYNRDIQQTQLVSYEDLLGLARFRRSVRWFKNKKVSHKLIDNAIEVASLSPSACNRQPFKFRIFDEPNLLKEVSELPMGTKGYNDNIPAIAAVVGDLSAYPFERDRHLIYIDSSLAAMSFIYALETQGISSCVINWPDIKKRDEKISRFLKLKKHERVIMLIGFGYPDESGKVAYSQKKDLDQIRLYN